MSEFRKKPVVIEATQWFKNGDHPEDDCGLFEDEEDGSKFLGEGHVVRYFRRPDERGEVVCQHCQKTMHYHGWIETLEGGHIVCPGDFIITGVKGERYPCKPDIFEKTYDAVPPAETMNDPSCQNICPKCGVACALRDGGCTSDVPPAASASSENDSVVAARNPKETPEIYIDLDEYQ